MSYLLVLVIVVLIIFYEYRIYRIEKIKELDYKDFQGKLEEKRKEDLFEEKPTDEVNFWKEKYERSRFNNSKLNQKVIQLNSKLKNYEKQS